ncbi:ATP-binding protein [Undibacterium sp. CY18W]|uniref:ATP-binding protein n=1 Tax=Undibacterium hunanense TaxID=2762292 RepID=A0ABR6ZW03_9BURK|nr:IS21-like element helper ATPase IstB [Undibacterium hunanense]MBC3920044.1 ATP-binding protein [Undibacterium hunanense]
MLINQTLEKLKELKLFGMAEELERQLPNPSARNLSFEDRIGGLVDYETTYRSNKRLTALLRNAKLKHTSACVEDIDYAQPRNLDKPLMLSLSNGDWVRQNINVIFAGPTGTGKSWLSCALGNQVCRQGMSVYFVRLPLLLDDLFAARATGTFVKRLNQLAKYDLLIIDDWGLAPVPDQSQGDLMELVDSRVGSRSTIITSQIPLELWHDYIGNKTIADAILDRLVHSSQYVKLRGETMRGKTVKEKKSAQK